MTKVTEARSTPIRCKKATVVEDAVACHRSLRTNDAVDNHSLSQARRVRKNLIERVGVNKNDEVASFAEFQKPPRRASLIGDNVSQRLISGDEGPVNDKRRELARINNKI